MIIKIEFTEDMKFKDFKVTKKKDGSLPGWDDCRLCITIYEIPVRRDAFPDLRSY